MEGSLCIDHIHMCPPIPPKYTVSTILGHLKGKIAMILIEKYSRLKKNLKEHSFWTRGYYVSTVGLNETKIRKYIQNQEIDDTVEEKYNSDLSYPLLRCAYHFAIEQRKKTKPQTLRVMD